MTDVTSNFDTEVATDSAGGRLAGHGGSKHFAAFLDRALAFPDHGANGTGGHVGDKTREELLVLEVSVMLFHVFLSRRRKLHGDQLKSLVLKSLRAEQRTSQRVSTLQNYQQ